MGKGEREDRGREGKRVLSESTNCLFPLYDRDTEQRINTTLYLRTRDV